MPRFTFLWPGSRSCVRISEVSRRRSSYWTPAEVIADQLPPSHVWIAFRFQLWKRLRPPLRINSPGNTSACSKYSSFGVQTSLVCSNTSRPPPATRRSDCWPVCMALKPSVKPPVKRFVSSWFTPSSASWSKFDLTVVNCRGSMYVPSGFRLERSMKLGRYASA